MKGSWPRLLRPGSPVLRRKPKTVKCNSLASWCSWTLSKCTPFDEARTNRHHDFRSYPRRYQARSPALRRILKDKKKNRCHYYQLVAYTIIVSPII